MHDIVGSQLNALPPMATQAWNLATALVEFAADGFATVDRDEYAMRLGICDACQSRTEAGRCAECGCFVAVKAKGRAWDCPKGKWPAQQT